MVPPLHYLLLIALSIIHQPLDGLDAGLNGFANLANTISQ
jgi:hypothetical protein